MKKVFLIISIVFLISEFGNCQWVYKRYYPAHRINQLSQEQLNEALERAAGGIVGGSFLTIIGTSGLTYAIIKHYFSDFVPGDLSGIIYIPVGVISIPVVIIGLVLIIKNITRIKEIKRVLKYKGLSLSLNYHPSLLPVNNQNFATVSNISITLYF